MLRRFGPQKWWPARTSFEVAIGAILTQNTSWSNVERAIRNLRRAGCLSLRALDRLAVTELARLIRPSGYYNMKARRLKSFLSFLKEQHAGSLKKMSRRLLPFLRPQLLGVNGIGPETADSILLYALGKPVFVVDAYTRRFCGRHGLAAPDAGYEELQALFSRHLPAQVSLFNEYHALIVRLGKEYCRKTKPDCARCPLHEDL
jgi:endonuclease-3 related protein